MPEKTAKSFITWKDGKRYYRCGDLVSEDANGRGLFMYGRCDYQVKIGGVRLEIEGVENEIHKVIQIFCGLLFSMLFGEFLVYCHLFHLISSH